MTFHKAPMTPEQRRLIRWWRQSYSVLTLGQRLKAVRVWARHHYALHRWVY